MAESETEAQYKQAFMARTAEARVARGMKQWEIAEALGGGMTQDKYKQYEKRSLLPHYLIERFCLICRVDPEWLLTGRGGKGLKALKAVSDTPPKPARAKKAKSRKAA
jgi:hypothetical protein